MSSRFLVNSVGSPVKCVGLTLLLLSGCETGVRSSAPAASSTTVAPPTPVAAPEPVYRGVIDTALSPGAGRTLTTIDPRAAKYYDNPEAVKAGKFLFGSMNCAGCHTNGGGGMAPSLLDNQWIYGGRLEQIHQTLVEGRPNGMPAWGGVLPDDQLWNLAAYVRSMSLPETLAAQGSGNPSQSPAPVPRAADEDTGWAAPASTTNQYSETLKGPDGPQ
jgi:cytochrome c oxidase cbb3-type subunit III